jgi:acyl-coenzyme A thioesterase PaaI-like protein
MTLPEDPTRIYLGGEAVEDERRAAKHRLVEATKRVVDDVALLDVGACDAAQVHAVTAALDAVAARLAALPSLRAVGGLASGAPADAMLTERSPVSGRSNPLAPPLHLQVAGGVTQGWAVWTDAYEGPPGCLHGGYIAAAFDDLMGLAQMASGNGGYTGTLTVRMLKPTPLGRRIDYEAQLDRVDGRKIWCSATARDGETLLAEAEIVFIAPRAR